MNNVTYIKQTYKDHKDKPHKQRTCFFCNTKNIAINFLYVMRSENTFEKIPIHPYSRPVKIMRNLIFCNENCFNCWVLKSCINTPK